MSWSTIRAIVAEDEPASRRRIVDLLARYPDVAVVAECATGAATVDAVHRQRPTVLFLDIRMPDMDGFHVVRQLDRAARPPIVFVTAHDRYAVRAFDIRALDYLLKPFDDERFDRTMAIVRGEPEGIGPTMAAAAGGLHRPAPAARLPIPTRTGMVFVSPSAVTHVTAEGCYVRIHTRTSSYLVRETLASVERRLASFPFTRVHRSALVNPFEIQELTRLSHGEFRILLTSGAELKASRAHRHSLAALRRSPTASTLRSHT